jgi:hypothetical protein
MPCPTALLKNSFSARGIRAPASQDGTVDESEAHGQAGEPEHHQHWATEPPGPEEQPPAAGDDPGGKDHQHLRT